MSHEAQTLARDLTSEIYRQHVLRAQERVDRLEAQLDADPDPAAVALINEKLTKARAELRLALEKENDLIEKRLRNGV